MPVSNPRVPLSPFAAHCAKWSKGCGSSECAGARRICLARGTVPCQILLIAEAPGESEDCLGLPLVGPAGQLLDSLLRRAGADKYALAYTNIVGCIPRDADGGKATEPLDEQVLACQPRLKEFIGIAAPRLIILVGALARDWVGSDYRYSLSLKDSSIVRVDVTHPAAILRAPIAMKAMAAKKVVITIRQAIHEVFGEGSLPTKLR